MPTSTLDRITIYPVKSLDGHDVAEARVLPSGALENDRRWRLVDMEGRVVNAKRSPIFHAIRAEFALAERLVTLWIDPAAIAAGRLPEVGRLRHLGRDSFHLVPGPEGPCEWLSEALGMPVLLEERTDGGFPDDRDAPGPTLVSTATLVEVGRWFGFDLAESRRRFRANLEIGGCDAFWEDTLASPAQSERRPPKADASGALAADPGGDNRADLRADLRGEPPPAEPREFSIGGVRFQAVNACRRCVVPTRDSVTAAVTAHFRDAFEARRGRGMRADVDTSGWSHLYRLAVNTRAVGAAASLGGVVRAGDPVALASLSGRP